jgi:aminoglycoside phosphotransferase (APT) family kinase protein
MCIRDSIPTDDASSIVHGDFRFDNVIVDHERAVVRAVLDWELSTIGHPLADFTYFLMVWRFPSSVRGGLADKDLVELGIPALEDAARRYAEKSGRAALDHLDFCFAYNMFRLAAIAQGVYARALQGNASSEHARKMGAQIRPLAALAWDHARKAGA